MYAPPMSARQTVLIVEDDSDLRNLYRTAFSYAGFNVREAGDGLDALHQIDRDPPAVIVLDLMLPTISGIVVRQEMAANSSTRRIPIVVVTGAPGDHRRLDVARVLKKPVAPDHLVTIVRQCLTSAA